MPKYVIERELAGAGILTPEQLQGIAQKSCTILEKLGPQIQWLESYVTDDKIYCVYVAPDVATVREHATRGGFPANRVSAVTAIIDPATAGALPGSGARTVSLNAGQKKMNAVATQPRRWLWPGLIAGLAILALAIVTLKDSRWFHRGPPAQTVPQEERQSPLAWQSRIWSEGFAVGELHVQSGGIPLSLDAINEKSFAKFPNDFTADVLWSTGFESGQIHATQK
jgi:Protein of unknown function (DUF4242)